MKTYKVRSNINGEDLGNYETETEYESLNALARSRDYRDLEHARENVHDLDDLSVNEVK